jgi:hypothetical protein
MKLVALELALAALATSALGQGFPGVARPGSDSADTALPRTKTPHHNKTVGTEVYAKMNFDALKPYEGFRRYARTAGCDSARVEAAIAVADTTELDLWTALGGPRSKTSPTVSWRYPAVTVGADPCTLLLARGMPAERKRITTGATETWVWYYHEASYVYWFSWNGHGWVLTDKVEGG